jgi:hypothetical protein
MTVRTLAVLSLKWRRDKSNGCPEILITPLPGDSSVTRFDITMIESTLLFV